MLDTLTTVIADAAPVLNTAARHNYHPTELNTITVVVTLIVIAAFVLVFIANRIIIRRVKLTTHRTQDITSLMQHAVTLGDINVLKFNMGTRQVDVLYGQAIPQGELAMSEFMERIHPSSLTDFEIMMRYVGRRNEDEAQVCSLLFNVAPAHAPADWRSMSCQAMLVDMGAKKPSIICTMADETLTENERRQEQALTEKYKRIFDQDIVGLVYYDSQGMMLAANSYIRQMLHFQGDNDPYFFQTSLFDRNPLREVVDRAHMEDLYFCTRSVIPERGVNLYLELRLHPTFNEQGELANISLAVRDVTQERELYLKTKENNEELQRINAAISDYERELQYLMDSCEMRVWRLSLADRQITFHKTLSTYEKLLTLDEFLGYFIDKDNPMVRNFSNPVDHLMQPTSQLCRMKPIFHDNHDADWNIIDCVPVFGDEGLVGCFGTLRNVTSLIKAQERLKEETRRAQDSGHQKSVFMANMTHEIRTPLNSIVGFSDLLPMMSSPEEKAELVKVIMNNCDMLLRLINDILEISSMATSEMAFVPHDTDFATEFSQAAQTLEQRIQTPGVEFMVDNPFATLLVHTDMQRVIQILTNFVTNAVKYTQQGHIRIGYCVNDGNGQSSSPSVSGLPTTPGIVVYCEDTGIGIPQDKQHTVFERFVKLNDYVQGTGLGLSICKAIAQRAGGAIGVTSKGEGHGSTFWFSLPLNIIVN